MDGFTWLLLGMVIMALLILWIMFGGGPRNSDPGIYTCKAQRRRSKQGVLKRR